jgi:uncharacterized protein YjbJ (UPF0337 family)
MSMTLLHATRVCRCKRAGRPLSRVQEMPSFTSGKEKDMGELIDKAKGKANQVKGDLTNDEATRTKGDMQEQMGRAKGAFERGKARVKDAIEKPE